jgi:soluble lytic murein transglycosylase-like protein
MKSTLLAAGLVLSVLATPAHAHTGSLYNLILSCCSVEFPHTQAVEKAKFYTPLVDHIARENKLPTTLVASVIWHESNFRPLEVGLMQIMPVHFRKGENWRDPQTNLRVGCRVLRGYYNRSRGDWPRALMMYNAGPGGASRGWGRSYAHAVLRTAQKSKLVF